MIRYSTNPVFEQNLPLELNIFWPFSSSFSKIWLMISSVSTFFKAFAPDQGLEAGAHFFWRKNRQKVRALELQILSTTSLLSLLDQSALLLPWCVATVPSVSSTLLFHDFSFGAIFGSDSSRELCLFRAFLRRVWVSFKGNTNSTLSRAARGRESRFFVYNFVYIGAKQDFVTQQPNWSL